MEAQAIVSYVLPGLVLVLGGACGALIYRRRAMFPVDGRDIGLVLLSVFFFSASSAGHVVLVDTPCGFRLAKYIVDAGAIIATGARVLRLWLKLKVSHARLAHHRDHKALINGSKQSRIIEDDTPEDDKECARSNAALCEADADDQCATDNANEVKSEEGATAVVDCEQRQEDREKAAADEAREKSKKSTSGTSHTSVLVAFGFQQSFLVRHLSKPSGIRLLMAFVGCIFLAVSLTIYLLASECPQFSSGSLFTVQNILSVVYLASIVFFAWEIRNTPDAYHIREELKFFAFIVVPASLTLTVSIIVGEHDAFALTYAFLNMCAVFVTSAFPVAKSYKLVFHPFKPWTWLRQEVYKRTGTTSKSFLEPSVSLKQILSDDFYVKERASFERHVAAEFTTENIIFWDRLSALLNDSYLSPEDFARGVIPIYYEFIKEKSPSEVNISAEGRGRVTKELTDKVRNLADLKPSNAARQEGAMNKMGFVEPPLVELGPDDDDEDPSTSKRDRSSASLKEASEVGRPIELVEPLSHVVFENALDEVYSLMRLYSWRRWRTTQGEKPPTQRSNDLKATQV